MLFHSHVSYSKLVSSVTRKKANITEEVFGFSGLLLESLNIRECLKR